MAGRGPGGVARSGPSGRCWAAWPRPRPRGGSGHPKAVNRWSKRDRQGGFPGLSGRRRGRRGGEQAALTEPQQQEVVALVRETTPDQLGLSGVLWTREAVAELIARRFGVRLAGTTMGA
jgi:transposase